MISQYQQLEVPQNLLTPSLALANPYASDLAALSAREQTNLGIVVLAALKVLLHRYTGQEEVRVIAPAQASFLSDSPANTNGNESVDFVTIRTDLAGNLSFRELLVRVREAKPDLWIDPKGYVDSSVVKDAQNYPFPIPTAQKTGFAASPRVIFAFWTEPESNSALMPVSAYPDISIDWDLNFSFTNSSKGLIGTVSYDTGLFDAVTITRLVAHLETLLSSIATHPDQLVATIPLLTATERQQMLVDWNDTQTDFPRDKCIHQLFEEQAERLPDAPALVFADSCLTYRELNDRANQLAHYLQKLGVGPDVLVALCVERSLEMIVGILGILKAGGAYVPLDPEFPPERLAFMLGDMQASILLTQTHLVEYLPDHQARVICLDTDWDVIGAESKTQPSSSVSSTDLVYAMYTSGHWFRWIGKAECFS